MRRHVLNVVTLVVFVALGLNCAGGATASGPRINYYAISESAKMHKENGNYKQAIEEADKIIELSQMGQSNRWDMNLHVRQAYTIRGESYIELGSYKQALDDANKLFSISDGSSAYRGSLAYPIRAEAYFGLGNYEQAVGDYTEAIRSIEETAVETKKWLDTADLSEFQALGMKAKMMEELEKSRREQLLKAKVLSHKRAFVEAYHLRRNFDRAIDAITEVIELQPEKAVNYQSRGYVYLDKGDHARAMNDFSKALQLDPNLEKSREGLMRIQELRTSAPAADLGDF